MFQERQNGANKLREKKAKEIKSRAQNSQIATKMNDPIEQNQSEVGEPSRQLLLCIRVMKQKFDVKQPHLNQPDNSNK